MIRYGASKTRFLPAVKQIANVAALPGIVGHSIAMPDVHSGYSSNLLSDAVMSEHLLGFLAVLDDTSREATGKASKAYQKC